MSTSVDLKLLEAFGIALRDAREGAGYKSAYELLKAATDAELAMPNSKHLYEMEAGKVEPGLEAIFRVTRALRIRMSELLRKVEDMRLPLTEREQMDRIRTERILIGPDNCRVCKRIYTVYAVRTPTRKRGYFRCRGCKELLASWNATTQLIYETRFLPETTGDT